MRKTKIYSMILVLLLALLIVNVNAYATDTTSFALNSESINVTLNGSGFISYVGGDGLVTWESSDENIVTVENGTVTGHSIGRATITATRGEETDTCQVIVVYESINIERRQESVSELNLVLGEYETENLNAIVEDDDYEKVENASITWKSDDDSVVTVDQNGTIKGLKAGKAIITASAAGVSDTCEVTVVDGPVFTDFSNAKYELLFDISTDLKITGITPKEEGDYYYAITSNNTKPTITKTSYGEFDGFQDAEYERLVINVDEKYMYDINLDKYVELNQDLYLWVIEDVILNATYETEESNYVSHSTKFVVEGIKLTRPELPRLNGILDGLYIWGGENSSNTESRSKIYFRFPTAVKNRNFKIKIGKVTNNTILQKIQNNDYSGITELLAYAKNNDAIYSDKLTTTDEGYYRADKALFDGLSLLQNKAYYYVYVELDDEGGKYYPIEGITLGQAWISSSNEYWELWAYTSDNFEWNDLSSGSTESEKETENDETKEISKEFNGHTYKIIEKAMSWKEAKAYCESLGGYLLTITSAEEQKFIEEFIKEKGFINNRFWLGFTDEAKEGTWKWITEESNSYTNWGKSLDNGYSGAQDYAVLHGYKATYGSGVTDIGQWDDVLNDKDNKKENIFIICEFGDYEKAKDTTTKQETIPDAGKTAIVSVCIVAICGAAVFGFIKNKKYKGI